MPVPVRRVLRRVLMYGGEAASQQIPSGFIMSWYWQDGKILLSQHACMVRAARMLTGTALTPTSGWRHERNAGGCMYAMIVQSPGNERTRGAQGLAPCVRRNAPYTLRVHSRCPITPLSPASWRSRPLPPSIPSRLRVAVIIKPAAASAPPPPHRPRWVARPAPIVPAPSVPVVRWKAIQWGLACREKKILTFITKVESLEISARILAVDWIVDID